MPSKRNSSGPPATSRDRSRGGAVLLLPAVLLLAANLAVFAQTARFDFLNFDDDVYVTGNAMVRGGLTSGGVRWAFTTLHESNWHPVTWLSLMLDTQLAGVRPGPFHITNLVLHAVSVWLLLYVLWTTTGLVWRSAFVAFLFAVHPLHVESVAWVSERKDVLSTVFWLLAMVFYSGYARGEPHGRGQHTQKKVMYLLSLASLALGLMSKPMLVTLPLVLLLWDIWPLRRIGRGAASVKRAVLEKVPFFVLCFASGVMTLVAQSLGGAMGTTTRYPIGARLGNAVVSYATYLGKTIVPSRLAIYYPHPLHTPPLWQITGSFLLLAGITALVLGPLRKRRYLTVGWLWYLITLLPVIGLVQVGGQAMADRYAYVPLIGLFLMAAWGVPDLVESLNAWISKSRTRTDTAASRSMASGSGPGAVASPPDSLRAASRRDPAPENRHAADTHRRDARSKSVRRPMESRALFAAGTVAVLALATRAHSHTKHFRDSVAAFEHALLVTDDNFVAHGNLGTALFDRGDLNAAVTHLEESLRIEPDYPDAHNNLAGVLLKQGKIEEARAHCRAVIARWPDHPRAHTNLGLASMIQGDLADAAKHLSHALELDPGFGDARLNLGVVLSAQGKLDEAIAQFTEVLRLNPYDQDARHSLDRALAAKRQKRPS